MLAKTVSGQTSSFTLWSPAMGEAWLPEADQVRLAWELGQGTQGGPGCPGPRCRRCLSPLLEPVGLFPERYRFRAAPGVGVVEALLKLFISS